MEGWDGSFNDAATGDPGGGTEYARTSPNRKQMALQLVGLPIRFVLFLLWFLGLGLAYIIFIILKPSEVYQLHEKLKDIWVWVLTG